MDHKYTIDLKIYDTNKQNDMKTSRVSDLGADLLAKAESLCVDNVM